MLVFFNLLVIIYSDKRVKVIKSLFFKRVIFVMEIVINIMMYSKGVIR